LSAAARYRSRAAAGATSGCIALDVAKEASCRAMVAIQVDGGFSASA
jgi:hypothetical protein